MFLCSVAIGKPFVTKEGKLNLPVWPPAGYDSIVGEVGGTGPDALNYPEVVVFDQHRAMPSYLIVYSHKQ
jgi:hypothetical protein